MKKTWRWFGENDTINLKMLRQIGVEGIVTALHGIPNGEVWDMKTITKTKAYIESFGLHWSVVESLPVSEAIKYGGKDRDYLIGNYIASLENIGKSGIKTVCYNFMPVLDWVRTDLDYKWPDYSSSLYFNKIKFAYFDIHILCRQNASSEYTSAELIQVDELKKTISFSEKEQLIDTIIVKTQGFINGNITGEDKNPVEKFKRLLSLYEGVDKNVLRKNLQYFLEQIMPVCEKYDIAMCIHPDDPPYSLLGLPRIVTNEEDIRWILECVDSPSNGLTFCTGSLSASLENDVPALATKFCSRTKFIHLRSTDVFPNGDFMEADHLAGRGKIVDVMRIFESENPGLPMRVDHGKLMLGDEEKGYNPWYSFHGRMLALGQVQGVIAAIHNQINNKL